MPYMMANELMLIYDVALNIMNDVARGPATAAVRKARSFPSFFPPNGVMISPNFQVPVTTLSAITADFSLCSMKISLGVGTQMATGDLAPSVSWASGVLCHELVHYKQASSDRISFKAATDAQLCWRRTVRATATQDQWIAGYYGTQHELQAHAEQVAYEIWLSATLARSTPPRSVSTVDINQTLIMRHINNRIAPQGQLTTTGQTWLTSFVAEVNAALSNW